MKGLYGHPLGWSIPIFHCIILVFMFYFITISSFVIYSHFFRDCYGHFWLKLASILPSSPLFTSIVINYTNQTHGRVNLSHSLVNSTSKWGSAVKTSKQRHMLGESKLLIGCFNMLIGGNHNGHFLGNYPCLLCTESELLLNPHTCVEILSTRPIGHVNTGPIPS